MATTFPEPSTARPAVAAAAGEAAPEEHKPTIPSGPAPRHLPTHPLPAYLPVDPDTSSSSTSLSPLLGDRELYARIASSGRTLASAQTVGLRSAAAFRVGAGQVFRVTAPAGPQVGDLNVWSAANPRERFWASRTRQLHAAHISVGHRLWSCLPYLRPLATITADSLGGGAWGQGPPVVVAGGPGSGVGNGDNDDEAQGGGDGKADGGNSLLPLPSSSSSSPYPLGGGIAGCHDLLGTRCDPYVNALLGGGARFDFQCHSNLTRAVLPWGLDERDVHDVLNVFQLTGLDARGRYWMGTSPARAGDFLEFFAETDLLCALSACPGGDLSRFGWTAGKEMDKEKKKEEAGSGDERLSRPEEEDDDKDDPMLETCRPLGIEIYDIDDRDEVLRGWTEPQRPGYTGLHGMQMPVFGK